MTGDDGGEPATVPDEGEVFTHERTFTVEDVREFGAVTGDEQSIHTEPDDDGRLVVQGLLSGSLMTTIGADLEYVARTMTYEFRRPVRTGEPITCEWTVASVTEAEDRYRLENDVVYRDDAGEVVIDATTTGVIWKSER